MTDTPEDEIRTNLLKRMNELEKELDREFAVEMADLYISDTPEQIRNIASAIKKKDSVELAQAAHKLKGGSLNIGAMKVAALCLQLEQLGKSGHSIPDATNIQELESEFERAKVILLEYKSK